SSSGAGVVRSIAMPRSEHPPDGGRTTIEGDQPFGRRDGIDRMIPPPATAVARDDIRRTLPSFPRRAVAVGLRRGSALLRRELPLLPHPAICLMTRGPRPKTVDVALLPCGGSGGI